MATFEAFMRKSLTRQRYHTGVFFRFGRPFYCSQWILEDWHLREYMRKTEKQQSCARATGFMSWWHRAGSPYCIPQHPVSSVLWPHLTGRKTEAWKDHFLASQLGNDKIVVSSDLSSSVAQNVLRVSPYPNSSLKCGQCYHQIKMK